MANIVMVISVPIGRHQKMSAVFDIDRTDI